MAAIAVPVTPATMTKAHAKFMPWTRSALRVSASGPARLQERLYRSSGSTALPTEHRSRNEAGCLPRSWDADADGAQRQCVPGPHLGVRGGCACRLGVFP